MLRRPRLADSGDTPTPAPPLPLDIDFIDVTRLEVVLDTGLGLAFDLEKGHSYREESKRLTVKIGKRVVRISANRILYTETRPHRMKRPLTPEQIQSLKQR